jgi:hypothetical protein
MDLDFLDDVKNASVNPHIDDFKPEVIKENCPKCDNLSLINNACLYCHYEAPEHMLGEPLGKKSFYSLREEYLESLSVFEKTNISILLDQGKFKSLLNKAKYRYNDLLDFFYSEDSLSDPHRAVFIQELRDIVVFFIDSNVEEEEIWHPIGHKSESRNMSSLFNTIKETIQASRVKKGNSLIDYLVLDRRISKIIILCLVTVFIFAISFAFLNVYKIS